MMGHWGDTLSIEGAHAMPEEDDNFLTARYRFDDSDVGGRQAK
jgi:hypothetical protein